MSGGPRVHRLVAAVVGAAPIGSVRRDVARPALIGLIVACLVAAAVVVRSRGLAAGLAATATALVVFALIFAVDRVGQLERATAELRSDAVALWSLASLGARGGMPLPQLGGYAMSPLAASALVQHVVRTQPKTLVELGPGSSTVLLVRLSQSLSVQPCIACLEHDRHFAEQVSASVRAHGGGSVRVIEAGLRPLEIGEWRGAWYDPQALAELPDRIEFLVVDGPPERTGPDARYPAYPMLRDRLVESAHIFVDDTGRAAERSMVHRWVASGDLTVVDDGGSFMVLRRSAG